jgi:hypothetical protein
LVAGDLSLLMIQLWQPITIATTWWTDLSLPLIWCKYPVDMDKPYFFV